MAWGRAYPSYTGTVWVTPAPESKTKPVVRPDEYRANTDCIAKYSDGTLKV